MDIKENQVTLKNGRVVTKFLMCNDNGMEVEVLDLGATMTKIIVPDQAGNYENVLLEWEELDVYEENPGCFGAVMGRIAGRIHDAKLTLEDKVYHFAKNNNGNTLHGGLKGFHTKTWEGHSCVGEEGAVVTLRYLSVDGEEGFPGNLQVEVQYVLNNDNALTIHYRGETDQTTVVNLTNHAYFNLSGDAKRSVLEQEVYINSDKMCELDSELIPVGGMLSLDEEKPFDFRVPKTIGRDIGEEHIQLQYGNGYDHGWMLGEGEKAAELFDPISKRCMTVKTDSPAVVMYTMNGADSSIKLSNGQGQMPHYGVCFETQKCPIGYNEVNKEAVILHKGEVYQTSTTFTFTTK